MVLYGASEPKAVQLVRQYVFDRFGGARLSRILFEYLGCKAPIRDRLP